MNSVSKLQLYIAPSGQHTLNAPQQAWSGANDILQKSLFAGQEMIVIQESDDEPEIYKLWYLNFESPRFKGIGEAKKNAPMFAKEVLAKMTYMIS